MTEWIEATDVSFFDGADRKLIQLGGGKVIAVFKVSGDFFAVDGWCSHDKALLTDGDLEGHEIMCPLHGARFDVRTGQHLSLPAVRPVSRYEVKVDQGKVWVKAGANT
ncbi:MAG TPA: non-heme iron oxygenase ferredoxin subunit [Kiritimatiellia bacterium]|nr:non-heme iron oxygenase ferredoxin subunit [Kiritimatiellia bacterium]